MIWNVIKIKKKFLDILQPVSKFIFYKLKNGIERRTYFSDTGMKILENVDIKYLPWSLHLVKQRLATLLKTDIFKHRHFSQTLIQMKNYENIAFEKIH